MTSNRLMLTAYESSVVLQSHRGKQWLETGAQAKLLQLRNSCFERLGPGVVFKATFVTIRQSRFVFSPRVKGQVGITRNSFVIIQKLTLKNVKFVACLQTQKVTSNFQNLRDLKQKFENASRNRDVVSITWDASKTSCTRWWNDCANLCLLRLFVDGLPPTDEHAASSASGWPVSCCSCL